MYPDAEISTWNTVVDLGVCLVLAAGLGLVLTHRFKDRP